MAVRTRRQFLAGAMGVSAVALLSPIPAAEAARSSGAAEAGINRVLILKKRRLLRLMQDHLIVKEYRVALGRNPIGHKEREGDGRTPEGHYHIAWRNPESAFHLSLNISYPSQADREAAAARGVNPGGLIMIHGQPNRVAGKPYVKRWGDWTDGCVAVQNHEMEEIWRLVPDFTPVEIRA